MPSPKCEQATNRALKRCKGITIGALEKLERVAASSLKALRDSDVHVLPPHLHAQMHEILTGLGAVLSQQQQVRGMKALLKILNDDSTH